MMRISKRSETKKYWKMIPVLALVFFLTLGVFTGMLFLTANVLNYYGFPFNERTVPVIRSIVAYVFCFLLASAFSYFAVWKIFKPLQEISKASQKIAKGDYSVRLNYNGNLAELASTIENFNHMVRELGSVEMMRNDFIANVSHEFKTPLSSLTGYITMLQDDTLPEDEREEYVRKAFFSIEKLNDLTDNILRLSRLEHQTTLAPEQTYRLDEQIRGAVVLLEPKWSKKNITFELDLPEVMYSGQRSLLFQVWTNLLSNAIKFSHENGTVSIRLEETAHHLKVYISDEGIGMSEETIKHIFDKFYQADTSRQSQGNGLGLPLCKEILSRCGGKIYVTSQPEEGSVFLVSLVKQ